MSKLLIKAEIADHSGCDRLVCSECLALLEARQKKAGERVGLKKALDHVEHKAAAAFLFERDEEARGYRAMAGQIRKMIEELG